MSVIVLVLPEPGAGPPEGPPESRGRAEALRRRDDLLARVVHQLRTPLNALLGWAALLRARRLDEPARARALDAIERSARAQARLIDELCDASRLLAGALALDPVAVEICPATAEAVEAARPAAEAAGVSLLATLDEEAGTVRGDPRRLAQIVEELLANAVRATPRGGQVELRLDREEAWARITVRDTGRGIAPDRLAEIFDGLRREVRPPLHGLGVGLWIVRALVEAHGGAVEADSPGDGRGATFTVRLPRT
jgi:signal transduction histidine kinase